MGSTERIRDWVRVLAVTALLSPPSFVAARPAAVAVDDDQLLASSYGKWAIDHVERRGGEPLYFDRSLVKGGMYLMEGQRIFVAVGYALASVDDPAINALASLLPENAVGYGTYVIDGGVFAYTANENAGAPYVKGQVYRRHVAFPDSHTMELSVDLPEGQVWVLTWRRLE
ncbi:MAG: hypothetical protein RIC89_04165 [Pseudomonadales bacterium]